MMESSRGFPVVAPAQRPRLEQREQLRVLYRRRLDLILADPDLHALQRTPDVLEHDRSWLHWLALRSQ